MLSEKNSDAAEVLVLCTNEWVVLSSMKAYFWVTEKVSLAPEVSSIIIHRWSRDEMT